MTNKLFWIVLLLFIAVLAACTRRSSPTTTATAPTTGYAQEEWPATYKMVRDKFPDVQQLTPTELAAWLQDEKKPQPVILDARAEKEFAVSHLPKALHAADEAQALQALAQQPKDAPVVLYCSIGYRSSALAQKLKAKGYTNVQNLEGSIFRWANENHPVYRGNAVVAAVHPFNEKWGRLLERKLWSYGD